MSDDIQFIEPGEEKVLLDQAEAPEELAAPVPPIAISFTSDGEDTLSAVEGIIRRQSVRLDALRDEAKTFADQLKSILDNDEALTNVEEEVKQATRKQKERKATLANSPESMQLKYKLKEVKDSIKDIEESLSNHLLNLYKITGIKEFDTDDGKRREFDVRAKLRGTKKQE